MIPDVWLGGLVGHASSRRRCRRPFVFLSLGPGIVRAGNLLVPAESFYGGFGSVSTVAEVLWRSHHEQVEVGKW